MASRHYEALKEYREGSQSMKKILVGIIMGSQSHIKIVDTNLERYQKNKRALSKIAFKDGPRRKST